MKRIYTVLFFLFPVILLSQTSTFFYKHRLWVEEGAYNLKQTNDGGYILAAGEIYEHDSDYTDGKTAICNLIKYNSAGIIQWSQKFRVSDYAQKPTDNSSVIQTSDSGYAVATTFYDSISYGLKIMVVKTDPSGNLQWMKIYPGYLNSAAGCIIETPDSAFVVVGRTLNPQFYQYAYWMKIDWNGNFVWGKAFSNTTAGEAFSVNNTPDGNLLVCGSDGWQMFLAKLNQNGSIIWINYYSTTNYIPIATADVMSNGNYAACAYTNNDEAIVFIVDPLGNVLSSVKSGLNFPTYKIIPRVIRQATNGEFFISCDYAYGFNWTKGLLKLDANLNFQWLKSFTGFPTQSYLVSCGIALDATSDGGCIMGYPEMMNNIYTPWLNGWHYYIAKTDSVGTGVCYDTTVTVPFSTYPVNKVATSGTSNTGTAVSINEEIKHAYINEYNCFNDIIFSSVGELNQNNNSLLVFPNPSNGIFTIKSEEEITTIEIYNVLGEKVRSSSGNGSKKTEIDLSNQSKGIYFVQIKSGDKIYSQKVVIE